LQTSCPQAGNLGSSRVVLIRTSEIRTNPDRMSAYTRATLLLFGGRKKTRMSGVTDFDFLLGSWTIRNRRRTNPFAPSQDGVWEEFLAVSTSAKQLDGRARVEQYEATFSNGQQVLGLTIRAFDQATQQWSIVWLDNRNPPGFRPLVGHFEHGMGLFSQVIESPVDGKPVHVRFTWDQVTSESARWQQAFSFDGGKTWETNWIMEHQRRE